jgi:hypothetical protein
MANETAYPLYWPKGRARTPAGKRRDDPPFSVGESYQHERQTRRFGEEAKTEVITRRRTKAVSLPVALDRLEDQLQRLGAQAIVLSTNLELRLNGTPRAGQKDPLEPGAAVYFNLKNKRLVFACDKWLRVADNVAAIAAHIRSIRSLENFGVGTTEQSFEGYRSIENFSSGVMPWRRVLGFPQDSRPSLAEVEAKWKARMKEVHPRLEGESSVQASQLNVAVAAARTELAA